MSLFHFILQTSCQKRTWMVSLNTSVEIWDTDTHSWKKEVRFSLCFPPSVQLCLLWKTNSWSEREKWEWERVRERRTRATNIRRGDYRDNVSRWREISGLRPSHWQLCACCVYTHTQHQANSSQHPPSPMSQHHRWHCACTPHFASHWAQRKQFFFIVHAQILLYERLIPFIFNRYTSSIPRGRQCQAKFWSSLHYWADTLIKRPNTCRTFSK